MNDVDLIVPLSTAVGIGNDAIAGTLKTAKMALFASPVALNENTSFAELEAAKATYDGYAEGAVTWSPVTQADDGSIEYLGAAPEFRPTGNVTPNMVLGCYVVNATNDGWLCAAEFPSPGLPMQSTLDAIRLTLRYRPGGDSLVAVLS